MTRLWREYSLSIVTGGLFLLSWVLYGAIHWSHHVSASQRVGVAVEAETFLWEFFSRTFENWQAELFNIFLVVVFFSYLVHKGSHEYETRESLTRIERRIKHLEDRLGGEGHNH
jgi:hypothetical protein